MFPAEPALTRRQRLEQPLATGQQQVAPR
jgi:hypothetical protein